MPASTPASDLIASVAASRSHLVHLVYSLTAAQATFKPDPSQWSILENLEHLVLAEPPA